MQLRVFVRAWAPIPTFLSFLGLLPGDAAQAFAEGYTLIYLRMSRYPIDSERGVANWLTIRGYARERLHWLRERGDGDSREIRRLRCVFRYAERVRPRGHTGFY